MSDYIKLNVNSWYLSWTVQLSSAWVHHGCWLLHGPHPGEDCSELSGNQRLSWRESAPSDRSPKRACAAQSRCSKGRRSGEQRAPRPRGLPGPLAVSFLHALPLAFTPLDFRGPCNRPAEHRLEGKETLQLMLQVVLSLCFFLVSFSILLHFNSPFLAFIQPLLWQSAWIEFTTC